VDKRIPLSGLKQELKKWVLQRVQTRSPGTQFVRIEVPTDTMDPLLWLKVQPQREKIYFSSRDRGGEEVAAAGCAYRIVPGKGESLTSYLGKVEILPADGQKFYGGASFYKEEPSGAEWVAFGGFNFILPRFEYLRREKKGIFAVNLLPDELEHDKITRVVQDVEEMVLDIPRKHQKIGENQFSGVTPDKKRWITGITTYLRKIRSEDIQKIVPARRLEINNTGGADPFSVIHELKRSGDYTANFLISFNGEDFFAGATPERLFRREGDLLTAESVAGTAPRGRNSTEDEKIGEQLLGSEKETLEHELVTNDIVKKMDPICELVAVSERVLLRLANLQHLYRRISGKLKKEITDGEILDTLFPTPAVSGFPREKCLKLLKKAESFDRGWYAGVIGFAGTDVSDYYVAIRSILMNSKKMYIYSGAGIVKGSDPEKEWDEIDLKVKKYKRILKYEI